jgi:hypothetical protein
LFVCFKFEKKKDNGKEEKGITFGGEDLLYNVTRDCNPQ